MQNVINYYNIAKVKYLNSDKPSNYSYANFDTTLEEGDLCVVASAHHGLGLAMVTEIINENNIPACKDEIMAHNGKLLIRPDSGDMVDISIRTIEKLWDVFGGTVNAKGYKELDPHIGLIYGDGCTLNRVAKIYDELKKRGFAANNVVFGVGAFCFHALFDENDKMTVITRDTFGMAMKATYGEFGDKKLFIYKDPKTDDGNLKKSHKGCCKVLENPDEFKATHGNFVCWDEYICQIPEEDTDLKTVFKDGKVVKFYDFMDIRRRMYG